MSQGDLPSSSEMAVSSGGRRPAGGGLRFLSACVILLTLPCVCLAEHDTSEAWSQGGLDPSEEARFMQAVKAQSQLGSVLGTGSTHARLAAQAESKAQQLKTQVAQRANGESNGDESSSELLREAASIAERPKKPLRKARQHTKKGGVARKGPVPAWRRDLEQQKKQTHRRAAAEHVKQSEAPKKRRSNEHSGAKKAPDARKVGKKAPVAGPAEKKLGAGAGLGRRCPKGRGRGNGGLTCSGHGRCNRMLRMCNCAGGWAGRACGFRKGGCPKNCSNSRDRKVPRRGRCNRRTRKCKCNKGYIGVDCSKKVAKDAPPLAANAVKPPPSKQAKAAAQGDKAQYPKPVVKPSPPVHKQPAPPPAMPEGVMEPKSIKVPGFPIKPNLNSFMYYDRIVSLYLLPTDSFADRKYIKMGNEEKLLLSTIAQDQDRKLMSFKLHRALAYTGEEAFGAKPFCYSLQPAHAPKKWLVLVDNIYITVKEIKDATLAPLALRRAASFCVTPKKSGQDRDEAISLTSWEDVNMVWRAVGKYVTLGEFKKKRQKLFTPESATFVVQFGLFHGMCWRGTKNQCECDKHYSGRDCHKTDCVLQKQEGKQQCNGKGVCQKKYRKCSCGSGFFGYDCQRKLCPTWGPEGAERSCNHRGSCDTAKGKCRCDKGWSGKACEKGFCPAPTGTACSGHGTCDKATGICSCGPKHWGRSCEKKKCESFFPTCSSFGTCLKSGKKEGMCKCKPGGWGLACQYRSCPVKDCSGHGFCDNQKGTCKCFKGWFGAGCTDHDCLNGCSGHGMCQWKTGSCKCGKGWGLSDCSERTCPGKKGQSCSARGRCNPVTGKCTCYGHSWGEACEKLCPGQCSNNGICNQGTGKCECSGSHFGSKCQYKSCPENCHGQGQCDLKKGTCKCAPGFVGPDCGVRRCPKDCNQNGKCVGNTDKSQCQCKYPYIGEVCELKRCPNDCSRNGICNFASGECRCAKGFSGANCGTVGCPRNCMKRGTCIEGKCHCFKPFSGVACEYAKCPLPCGPNGSCDNSTGKCKCVGLWTGAQCNARTCPNSAVKVCSGHGLCSSKGICSCAPGWLREDCSEHKCDKNCHSGICLKSTGKCKCHPGFFTADCSKKLCKGKGVKCTDTECHCGPKGAQSECDYHRGECKCKKGASLAKFFFSSYCSKLKCPGLCSEKTQTCTCSGHGRCNYGTGTCVCKPGYTGNNCAFHIRVQDRVDSSTTDKAAKQGLKLIRIHATSSDTEVTDLHGDEVAELEASSSKH